MCPQLKLFVAKRKEKTPCKFRTKEKWNKKGSDISGLLFTSTKDALLHCRNLLWCCYNSCHKNDQFITHLNVNVMDNLSNMFQGVFSLVFWNQGTKIHCSEQKNNFDFSPLTAWQHLRCFWCFWHSCSAFKINVWRICGQIFWVLLDVSLPYFGSRVQMPASLVHLTSFACVAIISQG